MDLRENDLVVLLAVGAFRVSSVGQTEILLRRDDSEVKVRRVDAGALLRPVVSREEAETYVRRLFEPCTEKRTLPQLSSIRALTRAPLDRQVEYARWYFRKRSALIDPLEIDIVFPSSELVLSELALALGKSMDTLRRAVRSGQPTRTPKRRPKLPPAPPREGREHLKSFWLGGTALVGERPECGADVLTVSVRPGAWHAYALEHGAGVMMTHADFGPTPNVDTWIPAVVDDGSHFPDGYSVGVLDAAALEDPELGAGEVERTREDGEAYGDRGIDVPMDVGATLVRDRQCDATCLVITIW